MKNVFKNRKITYNSEAYNENTCTVQYNTVQYNLIEENVSSFKSKRI